eukprot:CFRG6746T1
MSACASAASCGLQPPAPKRRASYHQSSTRMKRSKDSLQSDNDSTYKTFSLSMAALRTKKEEMKEKKKFKTWVQHNTITHTKGLPLWFRRARVPVFCVVAIAGYVLAGALFFSRIENVNYNDSIYWAVVTLSTVGYGDISPNTVGGKYFFCIYTILGLTGLVSVMAILVDNVQSMALEVKGGVVDPLPTFRTVLLTLAKTLMILVIMVAVGCFGFHYIAMLDFDNSFYFTIETLSTVGYGDVDLALEDGWDRTFTVLFIFLGVPTFGARLANVVETFSNYLLIQRINQLNQVGVSRQMLEEADLDSDGVVNKAEFILYYMVKISMIDIQMVNKVGDLFDKFDQDGNGVLDIDDIRLPANIENAMQIIQAAKEDQRKRKEKKSSSKGDITASSIPKKSPSRGMKNDNVVIDLDLQN